MNKLLRFNFKTILCFAALFVSSAVMAEALRGGPSSPEPADYALGFGAASLGFIIWRNVRRAKSRKN
jgi:hypothetical protein